MVIINYWQQISKRYLLSHLLLGVIAAGLGLSVNSSALPNLFNPGQTVSIITIASITKANLQESSTVEKRQIRLNYLDQHPSLVRHIPLFTISYVHFSSQTIYAWFSVANAIRAGPFSF